MTARRRTTTTMAADHLTEESIRCRVSHHRWAPETAEKIVGGFEAYERCETCGAARYTLLSNRGEVRTRRIAYPSGYLMPPGQALDAEDRNSLRLTGVRLGLRRPAEPPHPQICLTRFDFSAHQADPFFHRADPAPAPDQGASHDHHR